MAGIQVLQVIRQSLGVGSRARVTRAGKSFWNICACRMRKERLNGGSNPGLLNFRKVRRRFATLQYLFYRRGETSTHNSNNLG
jgi:hypothetical protein